MLKINEGMKLRRESKEVSAVLVEDGVLELRIKNTQGSCSTTNTMLVHHSTAIMLHAVLGDALDCMAQTDEQEGEKND